MWKLIRSLFRGKPTNVGPQTSSASGDDPDADFETMKAEVNGLLGLDFSSEAVREFNGPQVLHVLRRLDVEVESIRQQAKNYPATCISAMVWINGVGYSNLACALTHHFRSGGWLKREENASALWAKATLSVCGHYHHMVGPAMLANANCQDRLGNIERSTQMYGGVVKDFSVLTDGWIDEADSPSDDDRIALESLQTATEHLIARGITDLEGIDLAALKSQIQDILSRPVSNG